MYMCIYININIYIYAYIYVNMYIYLDPWMQTKSYDKSEFHRYSPSMLPFLMSERLFLRPNGYFYVRTLF